MFRVKEITAHGSFIEEAQESQHNTYHVSSSHLSAQFHVQISHRWQRTLDAINRLTIQLAAELLELSSSWRLFCSRGVPKSWRSWIWWLHFWGWGDQQSLRFMDWRIWHFGRLIAESINYFWWSHLNLTSSGHCLFSCFTRRKPTFFE